MAEMQTITLAPSGLEARYYRAGRGEPLLFLHHLAGLAGWQPSLEALSREFDVIAPYQPGWGPAKDDLSSVDNGLDLVLFNLDLLDALGIESAHVAGIGVGAWIAAELAALAPQRVRRLALVNPLGLWREEAPGEDPFAQPPGRGSAVLFADPARREELLVAGRNRIDVFVEEQLNLRAGAKFLWPIPDTGIERRLRRIKAPTLIVVGGLDRVVPRYYGDLWRSAIAGSRLLEVPDAGHVFDLEQPEEFARTVTAFLSA
ncbi:MAG TPA: alpha/beta hydrolase [Dehalococcoidia bacterium]|nr:alpha/beta hydrolase [Dehalococcoidia bacterium]